MIEEVIGGFLGGIIWAAIKVDPWTGLHGVAYAAIWAYIGFHYLRGAR